MLQLVLERITARIAVSDLARKVQVEHLGGGAWEIPNGVAVARFADGAAAARLAGRGRRDRLPRPLHRAAQGLRRAAATRSPGWPGSGPGCACWWPARATRTRRSRTSRPTWRDRVIFLGMVSEEDKARMLRSVDVYVAPNTGGESFGMILTEAMAAGAPVVASDLDAFRRVLDGGRAGALFPVGDAAALADALGAAARRPGRRGPSWRAAGRRGRSPRYDWPVVAQRVLEVYAHRRSRRRPTGAATTGRADA